MSNPNWRLVCTEFDENGSQPPQTNRVCHLTGSNSEAEAITAAANLWRQIAKTVRLKKDGVLYPHSPRLVRDESLTFAAIRQRWCRMIDDLNIEQALRPMANENFDFLMRHYEAPERKFRTLDLLDNRFHLLDQVRHLIENPSLLEFAIFYQYCLFQPSATNSAIRSGMQAQAHFVNLLIGQHNRHEEGARLLQLICATSHTNPVSDLDTRIMCDIDLAYLGEKPEVFRFLLSQDAEEHRGLGAIWFQENRCDFFRHLLFDRGSVYQTIAFRDKFEEQARDNMQAFIKGCLAS